MSYGRDRTVFPVTIASGAALSDEIPVGARRIVGIQMPAGWTAASITFAGFVRTDGAVPPTDTFGKVQDAAGTEVALTSPAADTYVAIADTVALQALGRVKIRSGTAGTPVNQGADRVLYVVCSD